MILKPHTLPAAVLDLFGPELLWIHQSTTQSPETLQEDFFIVAQEGNSQWPPYCLRWHYRPLPHQLRDSLIEAMYQKAIVVPVTASLYPRVSEGVSEEILRHNLGIFLALANRAAALALAKSSAAHEAMLASIILAWLAAFGLNTEHVAKCLKPDLKAKWHSSLGSFRKQITPQLRKTCTLGSIANLCGCQVGRRPSTSPREPFQKNQDLSPTDCAVAKQHSPSCRVECESL